MRKLDTDEIEELCEVLSHDIEGRVFTGTLDDRARTRQLGEVRKSMRLALAELDRGIDAYQILDECEDATVHRMANRPQAATEMAVSVNRRLMRLCIQAVRPFAVIPGER